jgi:hypothetical protein
MGGKNVSPPLVEIGLTDLPKSLRQPCPWTNGPLLNLVPLEKWSPKIWSPRQMVPNQFGPHISVSPQPVPLDKLNILGTICPGETNWLGSICPWRPNLWGPFVHGDRIGWGPFVQRDQSIGDQLWGTKCPGTICVWDQMCHSRHWLRTGLLIKILSI